MISRIVIEPCLPSVQTNDEYRAEKAEFAESVKKK
jgi:hypothetical protein